MRIVILVEFFPPKWLAGTELASYNMARYLKKRDHEISIITSHDKGLSNQNIVEGFKVYRISRLKIRFLDNFLFWFKIFWNIKKINPEIIHVQGLYMSIPAFLAKKILDIPYIVSGQGSDIYGHWPFKKIISGIGLNNSKLSIALTEDMKNEMKKNCNKRIEIVPNGIDSDNFNLNRYRTRESLGLDDKDKIVIFVGRLEPVKGLKYLIEAISLLKSNKINLKLLIVGDGSECKKLKLLVKTLQLEEMVIFVGKISNEKVPEYLSASDVFVLPSLSEGFPVVLLEAMASGLPIITTKIRGLPEIVQDGNNGFLVNPKSSVELADKIKLLIEDDKIRKKISTINKEKSNIYVWENIVQKLEDLYYQDT